MPPAKKRKQQRVSRERAARAARAAALARARKRRNRQRAVYGAVGIIAVVAVVGLVLVIAGDDDTGDPAASGETTTTTAATAGAAGKPCVEVADPLPQGAPAVPVKVGPPPTELVKEDLKPGTGAVVNPTDTLTVNYIGVSCSTGKIFDSSYSRNEPATFPLAQVIPGWQQGIPGMLVGGQRLLGIPSELAYGAQGSPPTIAPNEALWFVVEVLSAEPGAAGTPGGAGVPGG